MGEAARRKKAGAANTHDRKAWRRDEAADKRAGASGPENRMARREGKPTAVAAPRKKKAKKS